MAKGVVSWSQTAADNATADSTVNFAEGMAPSAVNNSSRALMASVAEYRDDTSGSLTTGGSSTAYTLTTNQGFASLSALSGQELTVRFDATNGASPTLNVDSLGAKALQIDGSTAVPTGMIAADSVWRLTYDNSIPAFIVNGVARALSLTSITTSGDATIGGDADVTGDVNAANVTTTGDVTVGDDLAVTGDIAVNTNKFTVAGSSGNTAVGGTLAVTGATTLTGALTANNSAGATAYNTAKAFIVFQMDGSGNITSSSTKRFNVSDISRNSGTGLFTLTFANALPTANYIMVGQAWNGDGPVSIQTITRSTGSLTFHARTTDGNVSLITFADIAIFGY